MAANRRTPTTTSHPSGIASASYATDVDDEVYSLNNRSVTPLSVSGTNTLTATATPTLDAYVAGQAYSFVASATNTDAVTLNIDGLGAKDLTDRDAAALAAGDIASNRQYTAIYDGTRFRLPSVAAGGGSLTVYGRNFADNPSFDLWQFGTSFSPSAGTVTAVADRWLALRGSTANWTVSRQSGFSGAQYCLRVQRNVGTTQTNALQILHQLPSSLARLLAGKSVRLHADVRKGADYSAGSSVLTSAIFSGTGTDETINSSGQFPTGHVAQTGNSQTIATTAARLSWTAYTIPSNATEVAFRFFFTPVGTAGAADLFEIDNVLLTWTSQSSLFQPLNLHAMEMECLRYLERLGGDIAANVIGNGYADSSTHAFITVPYVPKHKTPTAVTVNGTVGTDFELERQGGGSVAPTAIVLVASSASRRSALLDVTVASGLTAGEGVTLRSLTTSGTIDIKAMLSA